MNDENTHADSFGEVLDRALPYLQTRHNEAHTRISRDFAERILHREQANPELVIPAILLHDIGWSTVPEEEPRLAFGPKVKDPELTKVHERSGAKMAGAILNDLRWPEEAAGRIVHIIAGHDTRVGSGSAEESVVRDADKLFRVSAAGFRIDCARFGLDPAQHLAFLESQVDSWFFTETGARLAREEIGARREELQDRALEWV